MTNTNKVNDDSDFALRSYLKEIGRFALLDNEQELECSRRIKRGDEEALATLINANLRLVVKIAKPFANPEMSFMDLIQEGNTGLMQAAERFDYRRKVRFSTYACYWIRQAIRRALGNKKRMIRIPHRKREMLDHIQKISEDFLQTHSRKPTVEEISKHTDMKKTEIFSLIDSAYSTVSLDATINDSNTTLLDMLGDNSYNPDKIWGERALKEEAMHFLNMLRENERKVLIYRYIVNYGKKISLNSIGKRMGISPESARQIEIKALKRLREKIAPFTGSYMAELAGVGETRQNWFQKPLL